MEEEWCRNSTSTLFWVWYKIHVPSNCEEHTKELDTFNCGKGVFYCLTLSIWICKMSVERLKEGIGDGVWYPKRWKIWCCHFPLILVYSVFHILLVLSMRVNWVHHHMCSKNRVPYISNKSLTIIIFPFPFSFHMCLSLSFTNYSQIPNYFSLIILSHTS